MKCIMRKVFSVEELKELFRCLIAQDSTCMQLLAMLLCGWKVQARSPLPQKRIEELGFNSLDSGFLLL